MITLGREDVITKLLYAAILSAVVFFSGAVSAETWTLDSENSRIAFGSVKKDKVGEIHTFEKLNGAVGADGSVTVEIDLTSVQTNIDIRNERINEHVFGGAATATLSAQIDMDEMQGLAIGGMTTIDVEGALAFLGQSIDVETEMFVIRISETQVVVTTNDMLFVGTEDLGISAGIDKLMELAKLPGITRTTPVTVRMVFNLDVKKAEVAPATATQVALAGDVKKGKKVFRKCKACHKVKEGKNAVGPSLYNILGANAASVEGFKYSKALTDAGIVWDVETLTTFLKKPKALVPGTKMAFGGIKKDADIENLIAYLASN